MQIKTAVTVHFFKLAVTAATFQVSSFCCLHGNIGQLLLLTMIICCYIILYIVHFNDDILLVVYVLLCIILTYVQHKRLE